MKRQTLRENGPALRMRGHVQWPVCWCLAALGLAGTGMVRADDDTPGGDLYIKKSTWAETMTATREKFLQSPAGTNQAPAGSASGIIAGDGPARRVSLNVAGVKVMRLLTFCERESANCHIWGEPKLIGKDGSETRLTTLQPVTTRVGWGQLIVDKNWQNHPLQVGDRTFQFGIWVHADSEVSYALDAKYDRFETYVGEDKDRTPAGSALRFKVLTSDLTPLPAFRTQLERDYPLESGLFAEDVGSENLLFWFAKREDAAFEQDLIGRWLAQIAPLGTRLKEELDALVKAKAPAGDIRWLNLYARACRSTEIERQYQYKVLQCDLQQRGNFERLAKEIHRPEAMILPQDHDPLDVVLRRTTALLAALKKTRVAPKLVPCEAQLDKLRQAAGETPVTNAEARRALFDDACTLRRQIAFSNPLLNFDRILFIKRHLSLYDHMCDQFYGTNAKPGGGLYVLRNPFSEQPEALNLLDDAAVEQGRLKGQQLDGGSFLSPDLSFDAKQIAFAYVECKGTPGHTEGHTDPGRGHWSEGRSYHVFTVDADGKNLKQITAGNWNDFDPCWLPNGRLAFITERRGGYLRCGRVCPTYTMYDMAADGSDIQPLSVHETHEWQPSVMNDGMILYTRWDYVDRHGCVAHLPWTTTPDGRDARAVHGNFAPRNLRPDMELDCRAVPNSTKFVATAAPHHGQAFGSLVLVDRAVQDDDAMAPVRRLTPEIGFPESQGGALVYATAWPLSEDYYLCVYDPAMQPGVGLDGSSRNYGIYLVDSFGNKELIYRDRRIACLSPIPLRPTPRPPVIPSPLPPLTNVVRQPGTGFVLSVDGKPAEGTFAVNDVYQGLKPWPEGAKIKALRVYQILPLSIPSEAVRHAIGLQIPQGNDSINLARAILGTVPVEEDGSTHFTAPAHKELYFQALDERGLAVQSMRSSAYLQPGERLVCQGCHEPRHTVPPMRNTPPLALRRAPSRLHPDVDGTHPFSYPRLVQPVLDRNCVACHAKNPNKAPPLDGKVVMSPTGGTMTPLTNYYTSYLSLAPKYGFYSYPDYHRTTPGQFGARASKLYQLLQKGHHDVKLSPEDMHRITVWLDSVSLFYGVYEKEGGEAQLRGEVVQPTLE